MINLMNDYNYTAHPRILDAIRDAEGQRFTGYGEDGQCVAAAEKIKGLVGRNRVEVHFLPGGTIANLSAIGAFLRPHEAVIAPRTAHINMHETGAIEAAGHKVLTVPSVYGKAEADAVRAVVKAHNNEHMVKPKLLYISQATEQGTVYTSTELEALREACYENGLYLFIDGARLGNALASKASGLSLTDYADLADAFCIGGTKNGLLFGEALVICNPVLTSDFRFLLKQRGGLLSKGFLLGIQFQAILEDGLYFELAQQANAMAALLSEKLQQAGVSLMAKTVTNQVFFFASAEALERLKEEVLFEVWDAESDNGTPIRLVTTWQTTEEEVEAVASIVKG